jgi:trans-aconitate methyltransferase
LSFVAAGEKARNRATHPFKEAIVAEKQAQSWDAGLYDDKHSFVWQYGESLVELLAPQAGERILDLGCGTGHLTNRIANSGAIVVGLDGSAEMLAQARSTYPQIKFIQADAREFTFAEPFDAIFSNAVLHWITPPEAVIARARDALRPGGRFVAEFGGQGNVQTIASAMLVASKATSVPFSGSLRYYPSIGQYTSLLEAAGLEVRFATLFDRPTPLDGANGLRNWVRMFCRETVDPLPQEHQEVFLKAVEEAGRSALFRDGGWWADYRRLRIVAVRLA